MSHYKMLSLYGRGLIKMNAGVLGECVTVNSLTILKLCYEQQKQFRI
jgi:hypothetical protein